MTNAIHLFYDEMMLAHDAGPGHPERPERLTSIRSALRAASDLRDVTWVTPEPASRQQILAVHAEAHLDLLRSIRGRSHRFDADTCASPATVEAALLAAGAAIQAADAVFEGRAGSAFALVRPPGHHAEPARAMGFCYLNNVAIAAAHARAAMGCERVLIVDFDLHHGNGTQAIFFERSDVLFFSSHQWPEYPGTGAAGEVGRGAGKGFTVNVPLPAGCDDRDFAAVYQQLLLPIADLYRPQLVLVSAGFDAHVRDPLGRMRLTEAGFVILLNLVRQVALCHAGGRLALILEGGYDLTGLAASVVACVRSLGAPPRLIPAEEPGPAAAQVIQQVRAIQRPYWNTL